MSSEESCTILPDKYLILYAEKENILKQLLEFLVHFGMKLL